MKNITIKKLTEIRTIQMLKEVFNDLIDLHLKEHYTKEELMLIEKDKSQDSKSISIPSSNPFSLKEFIKRSSSFPTLSSPPLSIDIVKNKEEIKLHEHSLIAVDLDGTLCFGEFWGDGEPEPNIEIIKKVEQLYFRGHHIIIYTGRKEIYRPQTLAWLLKYKVFFHALVMEKMGADLYIDDKALNVNDINQLKI